MYGQHEPPTPGTPSSTGSPTSPTDQPGITAEKHALSLKVMRLKKPEFNVSFPLVMESTDTLGSKKEFFKCSYPIQDSRYYENTNLADVADKNIIIDGLGFKDEWALPSSFGKIYVGETFSSFISLHNVSFFTVKNVALRAELFVGNNTNTRTTLLDLNELPALQPSTNCDFIIEHPLSQAGDHTLVITVSYSVHDQTISSFYKVFKFPVNNPLAMNAVKVYTFQEHVFVHLELQNLTDRPLFVDVVRLDPNLGYELVDHSTHNRGPSHEQLMQIGEIRRFLYELSKRSSSTATLSSVPTSTVLGKIELQWKGNMGDNGMLVTNSIQHRSVARNDIEIQVNGTQNQELIIVEKPFVLTCTVTNRSTRATNLILQYHSAKMFPLCVDGPSSQVIGPLEMNQSKQVQIPLFALATGLHSFGVGMSIKDTVNGKSYPLGNLSQIMISK